MDINLVRVEPPLYLNDQAWEEIQRLTKLGYLREGKHNTKPWSIFNYTDKCTHEGYWNQITLMCRGLAVDRETREILINPMPKFFNKGEKYAANIDFNYPVDCYEKLDGNLIMYCNGVLTSRGSFHNVYVDKANELIQKYLPYIEPNYTYIFELIADIPENKGCIVLKYPYEDLVLLAVRDFMGTELSLNLFTEHFSFTRALGYDSPGFHEYMARKDVEGVVLKDFHGNRIKLKTEEYLKLHRLISHCTKKRVWEILKDGGEFDLTGLPDEFYDDMIRWRGEIIEEYDHIKYTAQHYCDLFSKCTDKEFANLKVIGAVPPFYIALGFLLRKGKTEQFEELIWKKIKENIKENKDAE